MSQITKNKTRTRVRAKIFGWAQRPRLNLFRSNRGLYAQIINDEKGVTLVSLASRTLASKKVTKTNQAYELGQQIAKKASLKKIKKVVFDRGRWQYMGRIKAFAEGARKGGLEF